MVEITVGYVAGAIAAATFIVRIWSPNALVFILAGLLHDRNTVATWTVAGRALQGSYWPDVLRTDSASTYGVRKDVVFLARLNIFTSALTAIAGVLTPLGLYENLGFADRVTVPFQYIKDTSPFGYGTPPRSGLPFTRKCGGWVPMSCPFSDTVAVITHNGTVTTSDVPYGYDTKVPQMLLDIYSSGTAENTTVSNYFDIQWRSYKTATDDDINNGSAFLLGAFRPLQNIILRNAIQPVEGLLVDTVDGGIGFRNHTLPKGVELGATWTEDLLFIQPETSCVNTNLTLDFVTTTKAKAYQLVDRIVLTDRGGFVNLNRTYPFYNRSQPESNPDLMGRAYKAAWLNNA